MACEECHMHSSKWLLLWDKWCVLYWTRWKCLTHLDKRRKDSWSVGSWNQRPVCCVIFFNICEFYWSGNSIYLSALLWLSRARTLICVWWPNFLTDNKFHPLWLHVNSTWSCGYDFWSFDLSWCDLILRSEVFFQMWQAAKKTDSKAFHTFHLFEKKLS